MARFASYDGTELAYLIKGSGRPLVCLPGGPGRAVEYLGDLGGLERTRQLVLLDPRGVGGSADADPASYRCDRQVADVEALRRHLGLARFDLLGHSAGANLAILYAAAFPDRLSHLVLVTPGLRAVGLAVSEEQERAVMARRSAEPWYGSAMAAREEAGDGSVETALGWLPLYYGRWDAAAQAHATLGISERSRAVRQSIWRDGAFEPEATRAAIARLPVPVLIIAGELDPGPAPALAAELAGLFAQAELVVQPGTGHFPWVDDPAAFAATVAGFLS